MDDETGHSARTGKRSIAAVKTPSPARRRRRRISNTTNTTAASPGASLGCVPRVQTPTAVTRTPATGASSAMIASSLTTPATRSTTLRTPPRHRRPPPPPARARIAATLAFDDEDDDNDVLDESDMDTDDGHDGNDARLRAHTRTPPRSSPPLPPASSTSDEDSVSIISADGDGNGNGGGGDDDDLSGPRDAVLDFLSLGPGDAVPFSLFTPSPGVPARSSGSARGFAPGRSPSPSHRSLRSTSSSLSSPSRFFRSPFTSARNSAAPSPEPVKQEQLSPTTLSLALPPALQLQIKNENVSDAELADTNTRRNSLSLLRTPSPGASARVRAARLRGQVARRSRTLNDALCSSDEEDKPVATLTRGDDLEFAPSGALSSGSHDQDWLFSFANSLSPLAPGAGEDIETSLLSLRFSPVVPSNALDIQRLLPPFPSPLHGPSPMSRRSPALRLHGSPKTPLHQATRSHDSSSSTSGSSTVSEPSPESEAFPNIRASTCATPGRDERMKLSSSSVMKMKLHVSFDAYPPSHAKREMEAINDSLKRKKQQRMRKFDEKQRAGKNAKSQNVQRKLLQTPVKGEKCQENEGRHSQTTHRSPLHALNRRGAQRAILESDTKTDAPKSVNVANSETPEHAASTDVIKSDTTSNWRRKLSLNTVPASSLPSTLVGNEIVPKMNALKLRKTPLRSPLERAIQPGSQLSVSAAMHPTPSPANPKPKAQATPVKTTLSRAVQSPVLPRPVHVPAPTPTTGLVTPVKPKNITIGPIGSSCGATSVLPTTQQAQTRPSPSLFSTPVQVPSRASAATQPRSMPKKAPCNCKKSKCLKLYCECFASGGYCDESCNCLDCANTPANETVRQEAIASRLEKNPNAFKPKIESTSTVALPHHTTPTGSTVGLGGPAFTTPAAAPHSGFPLGSGGDIKKMHKHGCHCKKSACQKRYCECFQAGVPCGDNCRCIDCKNQSPYVSKAAHVQLATGSTPLAISTAVGAATSRLSAVGARQRGVKPPSSSGKTPSDPSEDNFVSPVVIRSARHRVRIDREIWARNFSSPLEVSPRRERERTERYRAQIKSSRANSLLRTFGSVAALGVHPSSNHAIRAEPHALAASAVGTGSLTVEVKSTPAKQQCASIATRNVSPLADASRPATPSPPVTGLPKRFPALPRHVHATEALGINKRPSPGKVQLLPLFGDELPPLKRDVGAQIFQCLSNADLYNASLVNRMWSRVTMDDDIWDHANFRRAKRGNPRG